MIKFAALGLISNLGIEVSALDSASNLLNSVVSKVTQQTTAIKED